MYIHINKFRGWSFFLLYITLPKIVVSKLRHYFVCSRLLYHGTTFLYCTSIHWCTAVCIPRAVQCGTVHNNTGYNTLHVKVHSPVTTQYGTTVHSPGTVQYDTVHDDTGRNTVPANSSTVHHAVDNDTV